MRREATAATTLCEQCHAREAVWTHVSRVPHDRRPQRLCAVCRDETESQAARAAHRQAAEMPVNYDALRPLMREAEEAGAAQVLADMADILRHSVAHYGRVLPPDVAAFMNRHSTT